MKNKRTIPRAVITDIKPQIEPCAYIEKQIKKFNVPVVHCHMSNPGIFSLFKNYHIMLLIKIWQPCSLLCSGELWCKKIFRSWSNLKVRPFLVSNKYLFFCSWSWLTKQSVTLRSMLMTLFLYYYKSL